MTRAGRAPSAWLIPVVLKKPSPELPFKKIAQNTHVIIHSISLKIPTGWLKNQAQNSYASEWIRFLSLDHAFLKATWPCSKSAFLLPRWEETQLDAPPSSQSPSLSDRCHKHSLQSPGLGGGCQECGIHLVIFFPAQESPHANCLAVPSYLKTTKASSDWIFLNSFILIGSDSPRKQISGGEVFTSTKGCF